jgi:hypothetical protein
MYVVSNKFKTNTYSGDSLYKAILKIDNNLVPTNQISSIEISRPIIDTNKDTFYLGTFISNKITIKFRNLDGLSIASGKQVHLEIGQYIDDTDQQYQYSQQQHENGYIDGYEYVPMGEYLIDDPEEDYQTSCEIKCFDYAIKMKTPLDYSSAFVDGKIAIDDLFEWICNYYNIGIGTYPNTNGDIEIGTYDSTVSGKEWVSYIAEIKGCNAKMGRDNKLYLIPFKQQPATTINALKSKSWKLKEKFKVAKVIYFDAIRNYTYGNDNGNTIYIRQENPFINDTEVVHNIYDVVKDFEIYSLSTENYGDVSLDCTDVIQYQLGLDENDEPITYNTYNDCTLTYEMNIASINEVNIPSKQKEVTTNVTGGDVKKELKVVKTQVNNLEAEVDILAGKTVDISKTINGTSSLQFEDACLGSLNELIIYGPITLPIVSSGVNGYNKALITNEFTVEAIPKLTLSTTTETIGTFDFPYNLNVYGTAIDEFHYTSDGSYILRKVKYDQNGNKYALEEPIKEDIDFNEIFIPEYDSTLTINLSNVRMTATYMPKNDFTNTFARKVEVTSEIRVATEEINIEVDRKIDDGDSLISSINLNSSGEVKLKGNKIALEGTVTANDKFKVNTDGSIETTDIRLADGGRLIGGDGVYTSMFVQGCIVSAAVLGGSAMLPLGTGDRLLFDFTLPKEFHPISAKIVVNLAPSINTTGDDNGNTRNITGWCRNLALYKATVLGSTGYNFFGYGRPSDNSTYQRVNNAFQNGTISGNNSSFKSYTSNNIVSSLTTSTSSDSFNRFKLQSTNSEPSNNDEIFAQTGGAQAFMEIIGYLSGEEI